ncbi:MAG TPA: Gfo/Idh/MocA family oxidoreductase, partial [Bacteroidota bacterium]|nr:Gfo/Idh/MocA family oxidoreductase [Bacteroidota bacterium]
MSKIKVGVIGTGRLGSLHAKMYAQIPSAEFVGVFDTDKASAERVAAEYSTRAFGSIDELLDKVQAV